MKNLILYVLLISLISNVQAQNKLKYSQSSKQNKSVISKFKVSEKGLVRVPISTIDAAKFAGISNSEIVRSTLQLDNKYSFRKSSKLPVVDKLGNVHQRYSQYFNGIKVEFGEIITHTNKNDQLTSINGSYFLIDQIQLSPSISAENALNNAVIGLGIQEPMWLDEATSAFANYSKPEGELVVFADRNIDKKFHLAWKFDVFAKGQAIREIVYVNAHSGEMIFSNPIIKHATGIDRKEISESIAYVPNKNEVNTIENTSFILAAGDADTKYSGPDQPVETLLDSGNFKLISQPNGVTIRTYDANNAAANTTTGITDILDPNNDNDWTSTEFTGKAQGELDAHWGAEEVYDYWDTVHLRNSFDGAGASIFSLVHVETNYDNAFWNGSWMSYGDGSSNGNEGNGNFDILTSLDVCAHEIGHAVMTNTANLVYEREQGALNEGYSDIWAAAIEYYSKGTGPDTNPNAEVWLIGDEIDRRTGSIGLRSMSNPNVTGDPDTYQGTNWQPATVAEGCITPSQNTNDYCGVHTNSGVLNYWYYLTSVGGSGTNDNSDAYSVTGIGMTKGAEIAYLALTTYLTSTSDYADTRIATIQSAIDIYGACSVEEQAVTNAWHAVGVGTAFVNYCIPTISFTTISGSMNEGTDCSFTDVDVTLDIGLGASANANVNFTVGSGTATNNLDFELLTSSVTFPFENTTSQTMTIRVYHDGFVEGDETVIIDFTVNANGGDAVANLSADSYTLTISSNDVTPSATQIVSIYNEDFDDGDYEVTTGGNAGSDNWAAGNAAAAASTFWGTTGNSSSFAFTNDDNCNCDKGNDVLTTDVFSLVGSYSSATLTFDHAFSDLLNEVGDVLVSTGGAFSSVLALSNTSVHVGSGVYSTPWVNGLTVDMTPYIGQANVQVRFRYNDDGDWAYGMAVDDISVTAVSSTNIQTAINTGVTNDQQTLETTGTIYTSDSSSGNVMLDITNNQSDDYSCIDVSVSSAGTGAQSYDGSSFPNLVMNKTFDINPINTIYAGDVSITFYFTEAEIAGWEAATGLLRGALIAGREFDGTIIETSSLVLGSFGSHVTLTGTFTGLDDTFVFGPSGVTAMSTCSGGVKIWSGSSWLLGDPGATNTALIVEDFDSSVDGNIDACQLIVRSAKNTTIGSGNYMLVEGDITVNGTLTVEHGGSIVQVDADASVTNSGNITVIKTTPVLADTDFTILGSPMSGETRQGVYSTAVNVRDYHTLSFNPHPAVELDFPGADNWADEQGDDWQVYASGPLNAGEGYLVKPVANGGTGAAYTTNYTQGTLNNGTIVFNALFNTTRNDSPNMLSNPYASAINIATFIGDNPTLGGAVYFWEHQTAPDISYPGYYTQNYHMGDISYRNASMGNEADNGGGIPSNFIASGQGFGIKPTVAGPITFNNLQRVTGPNNNYRNSDISIDKLYVRVFNERYNLKSTTGIGFTELATDGFDQNHDTKRLATPISIYSLNSENELGLQGRSVFNVDHVIPLGFSTQVEENQEYIISISSIEGDLITETTVYLIDNLLGTSTDLVKEDYVFSSDVGSQTDRFVIVFAEETLATEEVLSEAIKVYPNPTNNIVNIISPDVGINTIEVYDLRGRLIKIENVDGNTHYQLDMTSLETSMYFVKINTFDGSITKRVLKN